MDSSSATFLRLRTLIRTYLTNPPYRFIYDSAGHLVGEYDSNNTLRQETVWLGDMPVALIQKNAAGIQQVNYLLVDHLNTPRVVLSNANVPIWRWDNADPFGNAAPNQDPDGDGNKVDMNLRFPGQYYDIETGLFYNYFRDYNPATGRYIASDPIGLDGGLNTYGYVGGNPVSRIDPTGEYALELVPICVANPIACGVLGMGAVLSTPSAQKVIKSLCDTDDKDPCDEILKQIQDIAGKLTSKIRQLELDPYDLFNKAYSINPGGDLAGKGTYTGHLEQIKGLKKGLARKIDEALRLGCVVPPQFLLLLN